ILKRDRGPKASSQARQHPRYRNRIGTKRENVFIGTDVGELQKLLDDLGDLPFKLRAGRPAFSATSRLCPWKRYCERRAELTAPDFSSRPFRNFLDDPNEAGHFVPRKLPAREVTEIARPDLGVVAQHDGGSDVLAESRVANREYRRLGDLRVAQQDLLDL